MSERNETPKVSARHAAKIHARVQGIYDRGEKRMLEAIRRIMDQPWDDSHDKGCSQAFERLEKIENVLNINRDPVTEDTPSAEALAGGDDV